MKLEELHTGDLFIFSASTKENRSHPVFKVLADRRIQRTTDGRITWVPGSRTVILIELKVPIAE